MHYIVSSLEKEKQNLSEYFFNLKKWDTALLLASLNIPINDMCLIRKGTSFVQALQAVKNFFQLHNLDPSKKVLVRVEKEDSLCENKINGVQLNFYDTSNLILKLITKNYNIILVDSPGDRLSYNKSFIVLVDKYGNFIIEILGKGFDATDLSKGRINPEIVIRNKWNYNITDVAFAKKISLKNISMEYMNSREILCKQRVSFILSHPSDDLPKVQNAMELYDICPDLFNYKETTIELNFIFEVLKYGLKIYDYFVKSKLYFNSFELIGVENSAHRNVFFNVFYK